MVGNLGFYEFTRMPFGLCNAPMQHSSVLMQNTLGELNLTYCIIYLDDVIIFGHTEEEHLECLWVVFELLQRIQPEAETLQVLLLPDRDSVPHTSCLQRRNFPE